MKLQEPGVLETSQVFFSTASENARSLFFYLLCCGNYDCNFNYVVNRKNYYSFLILYVVKGYGYVVCNGKKNLIKAGEIALIDCYKPHIYGTDSGWKILWFHFDGQNARAWYDRIENTAGLILKPLDSNRSLSCMEEILQPLYGNVQVNEVIVHRNITILLSDFLYSTKVPAGTETCVNKIIGHINNNLTENLTIEQLAERACLSPYYFIRFFKKQTGYSPHEFLIHARVNAAQYYLKTTSLSLKEICFACGFSGESAFSNTFRRITGMTPVTYRNNASGI
jgi:AraC-like DNA-binding protein